MKFLRFRFEDQESIGVLDKTERFIVKVSDITKGKQVCTMQQVIENLGDSDISEIADSIKHIQKYPYINSADVTICSPIEKPIHDILCVGVNYSEHLEETQKEFESFQQPSDTIFFSKRTNRILGSEEHINSFIELDEALDYEVELAVIIGKPGKNIAKEDAESYIFGYSVFNDISSRTFQRKHGQWFKGKSLDGYAAMGPVILHKSALPFPIELDVYSYVNGEIRQKSNTRFFLSDIPTIISELSQGMTLEAGDIIATGTPSGVGMGFTPPKYMKKGDTVICEIPPIGKLINTVK